MYRRLSIIIAGASLVLSSVLLSGCGSAADREPDHVRYVTNKADLKDTSARQQFTERTLYLRDSHGFIAPQTVGLPKTKSAAKQVLDYLVEDGPVANLLPNGFQATLPAGTEVNRVSANQKGHVTADFSRDILEASDQTKAVQSIVWTLTQFPSIKTVTVTVAGKPFADWKAAKSKIGTKLTRADGINQTTGNVADVRDSQPLTVYYIAANKGKTYDVPVTVRGVSGTDRVTGLIEALTHEPADGVLISPIDPDIQLTEKPTIKNHTVFLHFNDAIFENKKTKVVNEQAVRSLVLTLTGETNIQKVSIQAGREKKLTLESGKTLTGPMTRHEVDASGI